MNIENTQSQMRKGVLELLHFIDNKAGRSIPRRYHRWNEKRRTPITRGHFISASESTEKFRNPYLSVGGSNSGPPRKYFSLTEKGLEFYKLLETTWNELAAGVNAVTNKPEQNKQQYIK